MKVETVKCDECGAVRGEANHWLKIQVDAQAAAIVVNHPGPVVGYEERDICGQMCFYRHIGVLLFGETPRGALVAQV